MVAAMSAGHKPDLRNSIRLPLRFPVTARIANEQYRAEIIDISAGGVLLLTDAAMRVGSTVEFSVEIPSDALGTDHSVWVNCQGRVVRSSPASCTAGWQVAVVIDDYSLERREVTPRRPPLHR
jgi:hypothetical protein